MFGGGVTIWNSTFFDCPNGRDEISLRHSEYTNTVSEVKKCNDGAVLAISVGVLDKCYISQLTVAIGEEMINKIITCAREDTDRISTVGQQALITTEMSYPPPSNVHVEANDSSQITFAWDEVIIQCSSLQYIITAVTVECVPTLLLIKTSHVIYNLT